MMFGLDFDLKIYIFRFENKDLVKCIIIFVKIKWEF